MGPRAVFAAGILLVAASFMAQTAAAQVAPDFSTAFAPSTIGPGNVTSLTFTIENNSQTLPLTDLAFVDNLPAGVTLTDPAQWESEGCVAPAVTAADGLSNVIPSQRLALGQMTLDPQVSYRFVTGDGSLIEPSASLQGIWNFAHDDGLAIGAAAQPEDFRGRFELGLTIQTPGGVSLGLSGGYDGIGAEDYDAFSGELRIDIPLN